MNFIPYKVNEVLDNVFYQIPKELLVNSIYNNVSSIKFHKLNHLYQL